MRAPPPESVRTEALTDGYQVCARCGEIMVEGDTDVVPRAPWYRIFSHPHQCGSRAVRGWLSVRRAEMMQSATDSEGNSINVFAPRLAAQPCKPVLLVDGKRTLFDGMSFPACTCILDNERLFVEGSQKDYEPKKDPVWYEPSDELPLVSTKVEDVEQLFFRCQYGSKYQRKYIQPKNRVEEHLVAALGRGTAGASARILRAITWQERARTYSRHLTAHPVLELDSTRILSGVFMDIFKEQTTDPDDPREIRTTRRKWFKTPLLKMKQGPIHTRDAKGTPVEWALYSGEQLEKYQQGLVDLPRVLAPSPAAYPVGLPERVIRKEALEDSFRTVRDGTGSWSCDSCPHTKRYHYGLNADGRCLSPNCPCGGFHLPLSPDVPALVA